MGGDVSIQRQQEVGEQILKHFKKTSRLNTNSTQSNRLNTILQKLVRNIRNPKGFTYEIYYMDTTILNAFTVGGKIFVTKKMIDFCLNDHELACIIGHEIAHNELGHLEKAIQKEDLSKTFLGDSFGSVAYGVGRLFFAPFDQKDEAYSDMRGMDIAKAAGYEICKNKNLWERMAKEHNENETILNSFLSSHPYSSTRAKCVSHHVSKNYQIRCAY